MLAAAEFTRLAAAIKTKDFGPLHRSMAPSFQRGIPVSVVSERFRTFSDNGVDLTGIDLARLVIVPAPFVDEHGVLSVRGFVPTLVQKWQFDFGFLPNERGWALTSMSLSSNGE